MKAYGATLKLAGKKLDVWEGIYVALSDIAIPQTRIKIWKLEENMVTVVPTAGDDIIFYNHPTLMKIRKLKRELLQWVKNRYTVCKKDKDCLPFSIKGDDGAATRIDDWWEKWERHSNETAYIQCNPWNSLLVGVQNGSFIFCDSETKPKWER